MVGFYKEGFTKAIPVFTRNDEFKYVDKSPRETLATMFWPSLGYPWLESNDFSLGKTCIYVKPLIDSFLKEVKTVATKNCAHDLGGDSEDTIWALVENWNSKTDQNRASFSLDDSNTKKNFRSEHWWMKLKTQINGIKSLNTELNHQL